MDAETHRLLKESRNLLERSREAQSQASSLSVRFRVLAGECHTVLKRSEETLLESAKIIKPRWIKEENGRGELKR